jgi:hypothetical protein
MKTELERIMDLQPLLDHRKTPEMDERGRLVRRKGPAWLRSFGPSLADAMGIEISDLLIEGRDGTGPKTEVPWFRFASRHRSPSATQDWYCVYLFDTRGTNAYLSLGHGSTVWNGIDFRPRPEAELRTLAAWGREMAAAVASERTELSPAMELHSRRSNLGPAYEAGTALCLRYERPAVPDDDRLRRDSLFFGRLLRTIYEASETLPVPVGPAPEVIEALDAADRAAGKPRRPRGFRLSAAQRSAIELHAMKIVKAHLEEQGWRVNDTSANRPYDFHCVGDAGELYVEVKGTTSTGETIVLTNNEVEHHRRAYPANALALVRNICLRGPDRDQAFGGDLDFFSPWTVVNERLRVVTYLYDLE